MLAMGLLPGAVAAQGLGEVAREASGRRSQARPADVRCYTDADLRPEPVPGEDPVEDAGADEDRGEPAAPQGEGVGANDLGTRGPSADGRDEYDLLREDLDRAAARRKEAELQWRQRAAAARAQVAAARKEHDVACNPDSIALRGG